jgi:pantoate--beta-alanine ligase
VNPTQFGPGEDFSRYPRTLEPDIELLSAAGCDAVLVPSAEEIYPGIAQAGGDPSGSMTGIDPGPMAELLEGAIRGGRTGHFRGVCTIVAKLLNIVTPTHLLLGQKDYQQQAILRRMCADLNMPVEVVTCLTVREPDGLAMSSRNRYLSADQRSRAPAIYQALASAKEAFAAGQRHASVLEAGMEKGMTGQGLDVQYAVAVHADTLLGFRESGDGRIDASAVLLIAAKLGTTRLIDNMRL